jgi:hypothetical protein
MANVLQKLEANGLVDRVLRVVVPVVDGAAAGTFSIPKGAVVRNIDRDTPVAIPGTPTNTNLRIGSAANGQQYVADVDLKAQGFSALTVVYAARNAAADAPATFHYTVASSGGTAASQDGSIILFVNYTIVP